MPRLLDLFCGAGGCSVGYARAGFEVVGVDITPQKNYPFEFVQADALVLLAQLVDGRDIAAPGGPYWLRHFDAIHASPPCQAYTSMRSIHKRDYPDLVVRTRGLLGQTGLPWVIENVPGSPLIDPVMLEGQMFEGLRTRRRRLFETNWPLEVPFLRSTPPAPTAKLGWTPQPHEWMHVVGHVNVGAASAAMGIDWMSQKELAQAIPPAYTELIGAHLLDHLRERTAA